MVSSRDKKKEDPAFLLGLGEVFDFNQSIKKIASLKNPDDNYTYYLLLTHGHVRINFHVDTNNQLQMTLYHCHNEKMKANFEKLNLALKQLQRL